jgi:hypothetical protein
LSNQSCDRKRREDFWAIFAMFYPTVRFNEV